MASRVDRARQRRHGKATYRLVRYADDFVVMIAGNQAHAEHLKTEVAEVLAGVGLRLSEEKTTIAHIDEGFEFLGFRIQRQRKRGSPKRFVYTWPSKKSLTSITAKVKTISKQGTNKSLSDLLHQLNLVLRGWTNYFRHAVSKTTFGYLHQYTWLLIVGWLRRKHRRSNWKTLRRRYLSQRWWPEHDGTALFDCRTVPVTRYRYRGTAIPTPWNGLTTNAIWPHSARTRGEPDAVEAARPVRGAGRGNGPVEGPAPRPGPTPPGPDLRGRRAPAGGAGEAPPPRGGAWCALRRSSGGGAPSPAA